MSTMIDRIIAARAAVDGCEKGLIEHRRRTVRRLAQRRQADADYLAHPFDRRLERRAAFHEAMARASVQHHWALRAELAALRRELHRLTAGCDAFRAMGVAAYGTPLHWRREELLQ